VDMIYRGENPARMSPLPSTVLCFRRGTMTQTGPWMETHSPIVSLTVRLGRYSPLHLGGYVTPFQQAGLEIREPKRATGIVLESSRFRSLPGPIQRRNSEPWRRTGCVHQIPREGVVCIIGWGARVRGQKDRLGVGHPAITRRSARAIHLLVAWEGRRWEDPGQKGHER
jgi:hypothetical protein